MKISMICFSLTGHETGRRLMEELIKQGHTVTLCARSRYLPESIPESTGEWAAREFSASDAMIFIGSCGIAVRAIAPSVTSKKTDPAVLVVDECARHVISLLSGHLGGANALTMTVSKILGSDPVITTATDLHDRFAVDVFARSIGASIFNMKAAKDVSAALLAGENVGFYSEFPIEGTLPEGLILAGPDGTAGTDAKEQDRKQMPLGIAVTIHRNCRPFASTVQIVPPLVCLGIGCKKGKPLPEIRAHVDGCLEAADIHPASLYAVASIDLKKEEQGLIGYAEEKQIPFLTYDAETLRQVEGDFTPSAFVSQVTGTDNVCERSACMCAGSGELLIRKTAQNGVTAAAALRKWKTAVRKE
ncbi:MAG: cobalamin biosynthesis protein [Blautia sp.]|nr:cobalamin biosynthesis protein [Blautia sp.]